MFKGDLPPWPLPLVCVYNAHSHSSLFHQPLQWFTFERLKVCSSVQPCLLQSTYNYISYNIFIEQYRRSSLQLILQQLKVLLGQMGDVVPPARPGSPLRAPPRWLKPMWLRVDASGVTLTQVWTASTCPCQRWASSPYLGEWGLPARGLPRCGCQRVHCQSFDRYAKE